MKFRKKPVVIDAVQWTGNNIKDIERLAGDGKLPSVIIDGFLLITTLEGEMRADPGDWVIRGVKGELYPCKPDIFEASYEKVDG